MERGTAWFWQNRGYTSNETVTGWGYIRCYTLVIAKVKAGNPVHIYTMFFHKFIQGVQSCEARVALTSGKDTIH